ncbi:MAG: AAA family ATPase [Gammaproteobacteria bacterium]|nr:AAA family ATPase [Gammaproteobacteria bacterium]
MVDTIKNVILKTVRHDTENGCVFTSKVLSDNNEITPESLNVLVPGKVQKQVDLAEGKCFLVSGNKWHDFINKWTGEVEAQIKAVKIVERKPKGRSFIQYITSSDMFPNIGEKTAKKLYDHFDSEIFKILDDKDIELLKTVKGIPLEKLLTLIDGWHEDNNGKVVEWLDAYSLPISIGFKLIKAYQQKAIEKIESDPYRLISFTSWKKVDSLARNNFKVESNDPRRLHAAVTETLFNQYINEGNTAVASEMLVTSLSKLIDENDAPEALTHVYIDGGFRRIGENLFQSRGAYIQEEYLASVIARRSVRQTEVPFANINQSIDRWESNNYKLTQEQHQAVELALTTNISVITGGAGVGKTSVLEAINYVITNTGGKAIQMALAGRAAKRLKETTGQDAMVIASFLHHFDEDKLKGVSHIIIDECSMVDLYSFVRIFRKLEFSHKVVLVGDSAQLPPVGAGKVFHYLCETSIAPLTKLTKVWRQDETTGIPMVSQSIRKGEWKRLRGYAGKKKGVSFVHADKKNVYSMVEHVFGELGGIKQNADVKIICPTNADSAWGTLGINRETSEKYLGESPLVFAGKRKGRPSETGFRLGDIVMATKNNWAKEVMNGSLGEIVEVASLDDIEYAKTNEQPMPIMFVEFDHGTVLIDEDDVKYLQWGYAITCHKAQGSQFQSVIIPIVDKWHIDRTWIYTALTRSIDQVVFIGDLDLIKKVVIASPDADNRTIGLPYHIELALKKAS